MEVEILEEEYCLQKVKNDYGESYYLKKLKRFKELVDEVVGVGEYINKWGN
jgi:hypothetical protein